MLDSLEEVIREDELVVNDPGLCEEMLTFVYVVPKKDNPGVGKAQAQSGCHDDRVMSAAGAVYLWIHEPKKRVRQRIPTERRVLSETTGY